MRTPAFFALGLGFILMGGGLAVLTLRKGKNPPATPTKAQQREQAALAEENRKMWIGAGLVSAVGVGMIVWSFL
ncbi:MAG: hypothetical protein HZC55_03235 [Verrucomicrobia bacterium]|jgi:hypothetical protein|nr:hypothetical protein [Verrucomicrobiota bacterium]